MSDGRNGVSGQRKPEAPVRVIPRGHVAPDKEQLDAADAGNYSSSDSVKAIVESLTAKRFLIACRDCGMVIGGFGSPASRKADGSPSSDSSDSSDSSA